MNLHDGFANEFHGLLSIPCERRIVRISQLNVFYVVLVSNGSYEYLKLKK